MKEERDSERSYYNRDEKAFRSKGFLVAALSGVLLAVIQTIWAYQNIYQVNMKERNHILGLPVTDEHYGSWFQTCIMQGWIGCEYYSSFNQFLFWRCLFCSVTIQYFPVFGMEIRVCNADACPAGKKAVYHKQSGSNFYKWGLCGCLAAVGKSVTFRLLPSSDWN